MLVKWKTGKKYNIIPMHDVQKLESYELDSLVYCKFNSAKYLAYIKFIGKFIFCIFLLNRLIYLKIVNS